jgi:DNA polymerase-3 subunit alpha
MAFVTLEDMHSSVEIIVFSNLYGGAEQLLFEDSAVLVQGRLQKDEQSIRVIAEDIIPMEKAEESWTASIHLHLDISQTDRDILLNLQNTLVRYPGNCRAYLHLRDPQGTDTVISLSERLRCQPGPHLTQDVNRLLGYKAVETMCSTGSPAVSNNMLKRNGRGGFKYNGG